ncbi:MAG: ferritin-like domain-containing protein [Deltaproteobacteria bacterium]|nr:ferritin-like domain-containing protein [Deltaproteobacteria bacterium]
MTNTYLEELKSIIESRLALIQPNETLIQESKGSLEIPTLLKIALKNEMEATIVGAKWVGNTPETFCKLVFAKQVGDEAKHYRLIEDRLKDLGVDLINFDPLAPDLSPLTKHLLSLKTTIEKAAGGPFARESIAVVKNEQFLNLLDERGDIETENLYRNTIQKDEAYHKQLGETLLKKLIKTKEDFLLAKQAIDSTLDLAEELTKQAAEKKGIVNAPGC